MAVPRCMCSLLFVLLCLMESVDACLSSTIATFGGLQSSSGSFAGDNGKATSASLSSPNDVWTDSLGTVYVADSGNFRIRKIDSNGIIDTYFGTGSSSLSGDNGAATAANGLANGLCGDSSGNIYITGSQTVDSIRQIDASGIVVTYAGGGSDTSDGIPATAAYFDYESFCAVDSGGNLYIGVLNENKIKVVTRTTQLVTTVAGSGDSSDSGNGGPATSAGIALPYGLFISGASLYALEQNGLAARMIDLTTGLVTLFAGSEVAGNSGDGGPAASAELSPNGRLAGDTSGVVFVASHDYFNVRYVESSTINLLAGTSQSGYSGDGGLSVSATMTNPGGMAVHNGVLYVADINNQVIRSIVYFACTTAPTLKPSLNPTAAPITPPSFSPSFSSSLSPSAVPVTLSPTAQPSVCPSVGPTYGPSLAPSPLPSLAPSLCPSSSPVFPPTALPDVPTVLPTMNPSIGPSVSPTLSPSAVPTMVPSAAPSRLPSKIPTQTPSLIPSQRPSLASPVPTLVPVVITFDTQITLANVTSTSLDDADQRSVIASVAITLHLDTSKVMFVKQALLGARRRRLSTALNQIRATVNIECSTADYVDTTNQDGQFLFNKQRSTLYNAVASGSFTSTLRLSAASYGGDDLLSAGSNNATCLTYDIVSSDDNSAGEGSKGSGVSKANIIGIAVGGFFGVVCLCLCAYCTGLTFVSYDTESVKRRSLKAQAAADARSNGGGSGATAAGASSSDMEADDYYASHGRYRYFTRGRSFRRPSVRGPPPPVRLSTSRPLGDLDLPTGKVVKYQRAPISRSGSRQLDQIKEDEVMV